MMYPLDANLVTNHSSSQTAADIVEAFAEAKVSLNLLGLLMKCT